jgi:hypothetical protein
MHKKLILVTSFALSCIFFCLNGFAETCPSVQDIKNQKLPAGWAAYDSEDGTPLPPNRLAQLAAHIEQFALAEWPTNKKVANSIHCYYRDAHGSDLEAYFAKDNFKPDNTKHAWYSVSGFMHCAADPDKCSFNSSMPVEQQLAKK